MPDYDENDLIDSLLSQKYTQNGKTVEICIYRLADSPWVLEVIDEFHNSTVWNEQFETDREALDCILDEIDKYGIGAFIGSSRAD
jgi:hypothetical protein